MLTRQISENLEIMQSNITKMRKKRLWEKLRLEKEKAKESLKNEYS